MLIINKFYQNPFYSPISESVEIIIIFVDVDSEH